MCAGVAAKADVTRFRAHQSDGRRPTRLAARARSWPDTHSADRLRGWKREHLHRAHSIPAVPPTQPESSDIFSRGGALLAPVIAAVHCRRQNHAGSLKHWRTGHRLVVGVGDARFPPARMLAHVGATRIPDLRHITVFSSALHIRISATAGPVPNPPAIHWHSHCNGQRHGWSPTGHCGVAR
jgi:hypothetical protein